PWVVRPKLHERLEHGALARHEIDACLVEVAGEMCVRVERTLRGRALSARRPDRVAKGKCRTTDNHRECQSHENRPDLFQFWPAGYKHGRCPSGSVKIPWTGGCAHLGFVYE